MDVGYSETILGMQALPPGDRPDDRVVGNRRRRQIAGLVGSQAEFMLAKNDLFLTA
jgi:hypothetical protein